MKISEIDKDFEDIIFYLDANGFKPFASCDGVEANHKNPKKVNDAYIAFLKSPRIINLMAEFLKDRKNFSIELKSEDCCKPYELYGNTISGTKYNVYFSNRKGEKTEYFKNIIKMLVEKEENAQKEEKVQNDDKTKLELLEKVLEKNSDSDLAFGVFLNGNYQPYMGRPEKINELVIATKSNEGKVEGNVEIKTMRDMEALASILSKKYNINIWKRNTNEYANIERTIVTNDKCSCSIYFTDKYFPQMLEQIEYIRQIAHVLPTFEYRECIDSYEDLYSEYESEYLDYDDEPNHDDETNYGEEANCNKGPNYDDEEEYR
jgi:hypothetical protein